MRFLPSILVLAGSSVYSATPGFEKEVLPFFKNYCLRCHDAEKQKGKFRLDTLKFEFGVEATAQTWVEVLFRINSGEMPPEDENQPTAVELGEVAEWISRNIESGRAERMAKRGPVAHYRLSRDEYAHSVYDLLGVHFDPRMPGALNEDPRWHGFDRIGSMLSLSPSHVTRYLQAAEKVLAEAFPTKTPKVDQGERTAPDGQRWLLFPGRREGGFNAREPGLYKVRVTLSALPSFKGRMPHLSIWNNSLKKGVTGRDVTAAEGKPITVEFQVALDKGGYSLINEVPGKLDDGHTLSHTPKAIGKVANLRSQKPVGYKLLLDDGRPVFPLLLVDKVEYEGPIVSDVVQQKRAELYPHKEGDLAEAKACLDRFASRAWRRAINPVELDRYQNLLKAELDAGENFRSAYLGALTSILTSKNFYYIVEGDPAKPRDKVNDWELATRLSYFLWSSLPDKALTEAASKGELHRPEVLGAQLTRMLTDPKTARFTDAFPRQWLQLHKVGMFPPDMDLYPDYDKWLEQCMALETTKFFNEVFENNLSLREFLVSDWTVMNSRLALHYQMPALQKAGFQRVVLQPQDHRGGVLTQASVLMLSSDGTRHRPVHRGVWVSEAIFGRTPPPPPPNVEPLEPTPTDQPKATIRQQLEAHATHATCASCHAKIDPLGFAFDNFNAIGQWRTEENMPGGQGANPPVNASGKLPDGRAYSGPNEFKELLVQDLDRFAEAFVEQLATFALRRVMTLDDRTHLKAITAAAKKDSYKLRTLMFHLVLSDLFVRR
jgi:hypothetical protein